METFANQIESYRRTRQSFCSSTLKAFALMFVMVGLAQAEVTKLACSDDKGLQPISKRIDEPGNYVLIESCVVKGDGISIRASNVQLNLNGHTLSGPGVGPAPGVGCDGSSVGITVFGSNVHVTGGTVKDFQTGVSVRTISGNDDGSADDNQLSRLKVTENCAGIELRFSNNNHVNFNDISRNIGDGVVVQQDSDNNQIEFNVINENGERGATVGRGIRVEDSDSNVFAFNTISRNANGGVTLAVSSNNNTIAGNVVTETKESPGITVGVGKDNTIYGNLVSGNDMGIVLQEDASGNFVLRNTARGNMREDLFDARAPDAAL